MVFVAQASALVLVLSTVQQVAVLVAVAVSRWILRTAVHAQVANATTIVTVV
jgi:hypothetical protein